MSLPRSARPIATATVLLLAAGLAPTAHAGEPRPRISGELSLEDAVRLALSYNRDLLKAVEEREAARGRLAEAWGEALPSVDLEGRYERRQENVIEFEDPVSGQPIRFPVGFENNYSARLSVTQPVFQGGRAVAALRAARLYRTYSDELVRGATQEAVYGATRAYYEVLLAREQVKVAENAQRLAESLLADVQTKRRFGTASNFNVLRSQVEASNARAQAIAFRNQVNTAIADLFRTLGVAQDSDVVPTEALDYRPQTADERAAFEQALRDRADLRNADLTVKLREQAVAVARSDFFPRIEAFFSETYARPDPLVGGLDAWGDAWRAGITVSFNVFDGGKHRGRLIQERAAFRQAQLDLEDARETARVDVTKAVFSLQDAAEAVDVQKVTSEQAVEGLRLAEVGYREGTLDQVAVLEARAALTQAQLFFFRSLYAHAVARLDLARAQGALAPPAAATTVAR